jgi:O-antigen/teichoic acid export membrane protein
MLHSSRLLLASVHRSGALRAGAWSFADQAMVSFANFLLMVLLARRLPAAEFGVFVLVYMALYLAGNIQSSIITRPHNILGASLNRADFWVYTSRLLSLQLALTAVFGLLGVAATLVALGLGLDVAGLLAATSFGIAAWQLQEFTRQVQFTRRLSREVFVYDLISYGGQIALLFVLLQGNRLSGVTAMLALGLSSGIAAAFGFWRIGVAPAGSPREALDRNWTSGRWLLGDTLGQWLSSQMFPMLTAALAGTAATASYKLLQNVVAPVQIVFNGLPSFAAPRAARAYHTGGARALTAFLLPTILVVGRSTLRMLNSSSSLAPRSWRNTWCRRRALPSWP